MVWGQKVKKMTWNWKLINSHDWQSLLRKELLLQRGIGSEDSQHLPGNVDRDEAGEGDLQRGGQRSLVSLVSPPCLTHFITSGTGSANW